MVYRLGKAGGNLGTGQCQRVGNHHELPVRPTLGVNLASKEGTKPRHLLASFGGKLGIKKRNSAMAEWRAIGPKKNNK